MGGAEIDGGGDGEFRGRAWGGPESPCAADGGEDEDTFHPGEGLADALAGASAEGEVAEFVPGGAGLAAAVAVTAAVMDIAAGGGPRCVAVLGVEAAGLEAIGLGPEAGVAVDDDLRGEQVGAGWDGEAAELVRLGAGGAAQDPDRRVEAHAFGKDHVAIAQGWIIGCCGWAVAEYANGFVVKLVLGLGVFGEQPERKAEGVGGSFMAGKHDGEAFVAYLFVAHAVGVVPATAAVALL